MINKSLSHIENAFSTLNLRAKRQEVISANVANVDTPNYKAVDFDFAKAMKAQEGGQKKTVLTNVGLVGTNSAHIGVEPTQLTTLETVNMKFKKPSMDSLDGNTVDIELERAAFAENTIKYEMALKTVEGRLKTIQAAMDTSKI